MALTDSGYWRFLSCVAGRSSRAENWSWTALKLQSDPESPGRSQALTEQRKIVVFQKCIERPAFLSELLIFQWIFLYNFSSQLRMVLFCKIPSCHLRQPFLFLWGKLIITQRITFDLVLLPRCGQSRTMLQVPCGQGEQQAGRTITDCLRRLKFLVKSRVVLGSLYLHSWLYISSLIPFSLTTEFIGSSQVDIGTHQGRWSNPLLHTGLLHNQTILCQWIMLWVCCPHRILICFSLVLRTDKCAGNFIKVCCHLWSAQFAVLN